MPGVPEHFFTNAAQKCSHIGSTHVVLRLRCKVVQPHRVGKRLLPPLDDRFSARRGTYRIIYRIDDDARVVTVVDVGHGRDVYRT
jgi:mRNA-degrading endonuclease RelE of RelBE toxin-antitoxin system